MTSLSPAHLPPPAAQWIDPSLRDTFELQGTTAHRLASSAEGWVERLGDDVMISHQTDTALAELTRELSAWTDLVGWQPQRIFSRFLPRKNADRISPVLRSGDATLPLTPTVSENGIQFGLDFATGYSHGLFLDQRNNRAKVQALRPKRLLNTFAYTCSFSVVAASTGAETVSVDLSKKSLARGKQNFALNQLPTQGHRFIAGDTFEALADLDRNRERFDLIVLDPPTFSLGPNGRRWQVELHFEDLLYAALDLALPGAALLLSTNCTKLDVAALTHRARQCAKGKRLAAEYRRTPPPLDFPVGHGATTLWMLLR